MAVDLKGMLKKVLASAGKKKFFFAYGLGKRKDKKGEGELAVRAKKPKKAEIEAELADPGDVFEGVCWSGSGPDDVGTIYYQSKTKKLSMQTIARMKLTAKVTVGQQYDFQLPSPAEEARANALVEIETEGESETEETDSTESTPPLVPPSAGQGTAPETIPVAPPMPTPSAVPPPSPPSSLPPTIGASSADLVRRLNGLAPEIKAAMTGPDKARVQALFVGVNAQIKKSDLAQGERLFSELEQLVRQNQIPTAPPAPELSPEAALEAEWVRRMIAVEPRVMTAQKKRPNEAPWLTHFKSIQNLGGAKRFDEAMAGLDRLEALLLGAPPSAPSPEQPIQTINGPESGLEPPPNDFAEDADHDEFQAEEPLYPDTGGSEIPEAPPYPDAETSPEAKIPETPPYPDTVESESNEVQTETPSEENQYQDAYLRLLETLTEDLRRLNEQNPNAAVPIQQSIDYAQAYAEGGDFANAYAWLDQAAQALANIPVEDTSAESPVNTQTPTDQNEETYAARLQTLESDLRQLEANNPDAAAPIQQSIDNAKAFAQGGDFANACAWLDQAGQDLGKAPGVREEEPTGEQLLEGDGSTDGQERWNVRLAEITPDLKKALQANGPGVAEINNLFSEANAQANALAYDEAIASLDRLELLVAASLPTSLVAFAKTRLRWEAAKKATQDQIGQLQKALLAEFGDLADATQGAKKLDKILARFDEGLGDKLDDLANADTAEAKSRLLADAGTVANNYLDFVQTSPLVLHAEKNPFVPVSVRPHLGQTLQLILTQLKGAQA